MMEYLKLIIILRPSIYRNFNRMSFWKISRILWKCVQSCRGLKYVHKPRINQRVLKENESKSERKWKVETRNRQDQKNQRPSGYDISRFLRVRKSTKKIESPRDRIRKNLREKSAFSLGNEYSFNSIFNYKNTIDIILYSIWITFRQT